MSILKSVQIEIEKGNTKINVQNLQMTMISGVSHLHHSVSMFDISCTVVPVS